MVAVKELLLCFGNASGLVCNFSKSSVSPIRCTTEDILDIIVATGCAAKELPITYMGLPLSVRNLTRAELQPLIDRIAN